MKKDVAIAIIVGFLSGIIIALVVINFPTFLKSVKSKLAFQKTNQPLEKKITPAVSIAKLPLNLEITEPKNNYIAKNKEIEIKGKAQSAETVIVDANSTSQIAKLSDNGEFTIPISLSEGGNEVFITAYNETGEGETQVLAIFYTTEKL